MDANEMTNIYLTAKFDKVVIGLRLCKQLLDELNDEACFERYDKYYSLANVLDEISTESIDIGEQLHCLFDHIED